MLQMVEYLSEFADGSGIETIEQRKMYQYELYELLQVLELSVAMLNIDFVQRVGTSDSVIYFIRDCVNDEIYEKKVRRLSAEYYKLKEVV